MCVCCWTTGRLSESRRLFFLFFSNGRFYFSLTTEKLGRTLEPCSVFPPDGLGLVFISDVPEERSPQMAHKRFWETMGPGLWADSGLKPKGGLTSSELLTACRPDMDTVELIWDGPRVVRWREIKWWKKEEIFQLNKIVFLIFISEKQISNNRKIHVNFLCSITHAWLSLNP